ncbi:nitrate reductase subunit alpha [Salmonella enterica subsp. enterica serovar Brandenburg]|nr:nitrate reductase subunit alpha [Salmonella enterica subsp. enterica serovar Brandenburg]
MSKFLDRFRYFKQKGETFADGHGQLLETNRDWEDGYRQRWQHDKIVRSTHGVNCTGSCSWKIYVKNGLVTWETQQTDYPRTRPDMPNHEPRGCPRGASYSWYLYSANRLKYPLMRKRLMKMWREAKKLHRDPVEAWASIIEDADKAKSFKQARGRGGFVRSSWQEVNELIAASNVYTVKTYGPDRVAGFSPIPAMSMVSYASGARYLSLIGGTCLSFYDWYCDLPPASPQTWGEQTDVPESADWYNSSYIIAWGSNVPQTRTPDAHFFTEVRYKGTKTVAVTPDYAEIAKLCDLWLAPKQGTDAAMALAMGHVMLREFHLDNPRQYFTDYVRRYTDMPMLVMLEERDGYYAAGRMLRAADLVDSLGQENNPEWKTVAINSNGEMVAPNGSIGFRWGEKGKWNLEQRDGTTGAETELQLSLLGSQDEIADVGFPYFGGEGSEYFNHVALDNVLLHKLPAKRLQLADGSTALVTTVYDLTMANYGLERGLNDENCAASYDDTKAYTPAWAEQITGVPRAQIIRIAREQALKDGVPQSVIDAAQQSPVYKMAMDWKLALPLHPEYRTLPMVWYVPPLSPIQSAADAGELGSNGILPDVDSLRIPVQYLANLLTAGDTQPVLLALKRMLAMRHYKRAETVDGKVDTRALEEVGLSEAQAQEMYRYLAIANYEDRFVVPSSHRELARDAFPEKNGCGFTFGDGCHGSDTKFNLFNSRRIDAVDVTSKTEPHA